VIHSYVFVCIFSLLSLHKGKVARWDHLPVCPLSTSEPIGRFLWNSVGGTCRWKSRSFSHPKMADVQTFEMEASLAPVSVGPWHFVCWQIFGEWTTFNKTTFVENQKYENSERWKVKIHILFCGENSWAVAFKRMKFWTLKGHAHASFIWIILCDGVFLDMAVFRNYEDMLGQTLN
jgi:hypothetical protein